MVFKDKGPVFLCCYSFSSMMFMIILLFIFPLRSVSIWLIYLTVLMCDYIYVYKYIYIYDYCILLINWSLYHHVITLFICCYFFDLRSVLSDVSMITNTLFWFLIAWNIFCHSDTLSLFILLRTELNWVFYRQYITGSFILIYPPLFDWRI